jgi:hypothetical protein
MLENIDKWVQKCEEIYSSDNELKKSLTNELSICVWVGGTEGAKKSKT